VHEGCASSGSQISSEKFELETKQKEMGSGHAGQGVVQFARRLDGNHITLFAIKFFASRKEFLEEVEVYRSSPLRSFMPSVLHFEGNEDCRIRDPFGGLIAPFIVMEKGESLQERARNCRVDVFTAAQVSRKFSVFPEIQYPLLMIMLTKCQLILYLCQGVPK
jgi:hypothetical protein